MVSSAKYNKRRDVRILLLTVLLVIVVNLVGKIFFFRVDLTADKRYTLKPVTKELLRKLEKPVYVKIYLEGKLPPAFVRLQKETKEMLQEFEAYSSKIKFDFVDINAIADEKMRNTQIEELVAKGIRPTNLKVAEKGETSRKLIFPAAELIAGEKTETVELLQSQLYLSPEEALNMSIQALEFNFATALYKIQLDNKKTVAFSAGHEELDPYHSIEAAFSIAGMYDVSKVFINDSPERLLVKDSTGKIQPRYDVLVLAQPKKRFSDIDRWTIDQYLMHGGKILWMLDQADASLDSLKRYGEQIVVPYDLNLQDLLFKYGVRINQNLLMDLHAMPIPLITGYVGDQPQTEMFPYYYCPLIFAVTQHPVTQQLNILSTEFVSSLDTIESPARKTVLLTTSPYSSYANVPMMLDFEILKEKVDQRRFNKGAQTIAMLLEGKFESAFKNRIAYGLEKMDWVSKFEVDNSAMIVVADGDMMKNSVNPKNNAPLPLGFDPYTKTNYGNKDFFVNSVMYLCGDVKLLDLKARNVDLRMLDQQKVEQEKTKWQLINVVIPILIIIVLAIVLIGYRNKKYTNHIF